MEVHGPHTLEDQIGSAIAGSTRLKITSDETKIDPEDYPIIIEALFNDLRSIGREIRAKISQAGIIVSSLFKAKEPAEVIRNIDFTKSRHLSPLLTKKPTTFVDFKRGQIIPPPSTPVTPLMDDQEDDAADWW